MPQSSYQSPERTAENSLAYATGETGRLVGEVFGALEQGVQVPHLATVVARNLARAADATRATAILWHLDGSLWAGATRLADGTPDLHVWAATHSRFRAIPAVIQAIDEQRIVQANDLKDDDASYWLGALGIETLAVVPLVHREIVVGVGLIDGADIPMPRHVMKAIDAVAAAGAGAIALAGTIATERLEWQRANQVLTTVTRAASSLDAASVLSAIADGIGDALGDKLSMAFLVADGSATRLAISGDGIGAVDLADTLVQRENSRMPGVGPMLLYPALDDEPELAALGFGRILVAPLRRGGIDLGWVVSADQADRPYSSNDVRVASAICAQASLSLHTASLLETERSSVARLEELDRLKTAFVGAVSHELRTPLTAVIGYGEILAEQSEDPTIAIFVDEMRREAGVLESMIGNLLDTTRLEAGMLQLNRTTIDLAEIVRRAIEVVVHGHRARTINLTELGKPATVTGDAARLRQVFVNLVENAAKYSPGDQPIDVTIDWGLYSALGAIVRITVDDHGSGVPANQRDAIFQRFHRLAADGGTPGTGIGLYLVRALVEAHGGVAEVVDRPGATGARFVVNLPVDL
jgi:signal transduction histidine kinase